MKHLALLTTLSLTLLCTSVRAQIDSLLTYPYKKEIQQIARVDGQEIEYLRITDANGQQEYCRLVLTDYGLSSNVYQLVLKEEEAQKLADVLNSFYVIAKSPTPPIYTEHADLPAKNYLKASVWADKNSGWRIGLDVSPLLTIEPVKLNLDKVPDFVKAIRTCIEVIKAKE